MEKATKRTAKFEVKCLKRFRDKHTKKIHKKGDIFKVTEERFNEILEVDNLVEKYTKPEKDESEKAEK